MYLSPSVLARLSVHLVQLSHLSIWCSSSICSSFTIWPFCLSLSIWSSSSFYSSALAFPSGPTLPIYSNFCLSIRSIFVHLVQLLHLPKLLHFLHSFLLSSISGSVRWRRVFFFYWLVIEWSSQSPKLSNCSMAQNWCLQIVLEIFIRTNNLKYLDNFLFQHLYYFSHSSLT